MEKGFLNNNSGSKVVTSDDETAEVDINSLLSSFNDTIKNMEGSEGAKFGDTGAATNTSSTVHGGAVPVLNVCGVGTCSTDPKVTYNAKATSFANILNPERTKNKINFRPLINEVQVENHDTMLPKAVMESVLSRYENTLVGYFVGKTIAFPIVKNYVTNTWGKFGLKRLMKNDAGVYLFKFDSKDGVDRVLESGPWLIRKSPLILNKWTPKVPLTKNEVTKVPVWIKLHNVPLVAYSEDGLSLIATQVGKPILLDAFTSSMCVDSWGRISFARALVELSANSDLKSEVTMAIPNEEDSGYTTEIIKVEYEWTPPHCDLCNVFGHDRISCPKCVKETLRSDTTVAAKASATLENNDEGFIEVKNRKDKGKKVALQSRPIGGVKLNKPKPNFWRPKSTATTNQHSDSKVQKETSSSNDKPGINTKSSNKFDVLNSLGEEDVTDPSRDVQVSVLKPVISTSCTSEDIPSPSIAPPSSTMKSSPNQVVDGIRKGNPFSKVGEVDDSDSDDDEVFEPNDHMESYFSSAGGGNAFVDLISDEDAAHVYDLPRHLDEFCDQFDVKLQGRPRK